MTATTAAALTKIAEGREAEVFAWEPGSVLKLYRGAEWAGSAQVEMAAMTAVREAGGPAPRAIEITEVDGRPGLVMERIEGIDMLTRIGKQPWRVVSAGGVMGRVHAALNATEAPDTIEPVKRRLERRITDVGTVRPDLRDRGLSALAPLPDGDRLCHGDFHPANIILTARGPVVIDWPNSSRGDPAADFARSALMLRLGALPPGTPFLIRKLDRIGRGFLRSRYLAAYRAARPDDVKRVDAWMLPVAIARLADRIEEEKDALLAFIARCDPAAPIVATQN